jgi:hypothetical protein
MMTLILYPIIFIRSIIYMFTKLYLDTTNPKLKLCELFKPKILFPMIGSIVFHTLVYTLFCNLVSYIFVNKLLSKQINTRLVVSLIIIMMFGFIARFYNVKDIYHTYRNMKKTRNHLDKLFISWIFIS